MFLLVYFVLVLVMDSYFKTWFSEGTVSSTGLVLRLWNVFNPRKCFIYSLPCFQFGRFFPEVRAWRLLSQKYLRGGYTIIYLCLVTCTYLGECSSLLCGWWMLFTTLWLVNVFALMKEWKKICLHLHLLVSVDDHISWWMLFKTFNFPKICMCSR